MLTRYVVVPRINGHFAVWDSFRNQPVFNADCLRDERIAETLANIHNQVYRAFRCS